MNNSKSCHVSYNESPTRQPHTSIPAHSSVLPHTPATTFFTPSTISDLTSNTSKSNTLDLVRRDDVITKLLSIEGVGLQNGTAIQLEYYAYTDYNNHTSLQGLFNMISEGKVCVSQNAAEDLQIWWNQEYLNTLRETVPYNKSNSCIN